VESGDSQASRVSSRISPASSKGASPVLFPPRNLRQTLFGLYVQDDWRWKSNLTLNLGLRYEMTSVPTETAGKLSVLRNLSDATPHLGDPFFGNPTTKNFEPRIGFAWDPLRNGKMAIRGGAVVFDVLPLPYQFTLLTTLAAPFFHIRRLPPCPNPLPNPPPACIKPGSFFDGLGALPADPKKLRATYIDPNPKRNYVAQWNLNVQYQLTSSLTSMIAYVGSRGIHQPYRVDDADMALPTITSAGYLWDPSADRINTNYGSIRGMFYEGRSYYNALETQLAKRMSHGFQMQGTFTWGKSIDTSSATVGRRCLWQFHLEPAVFSSIRS